MTGFETLIGAATVGVTSLITEIIKEKGNETLKSLDFDISKHNRLKQAVWEYVKRYSDRHGILKVSCVRMNNPVRLDDIYTAVQMLDRSALMYYESTEALQELFRESGKRGFDFHRVEKREGIEVANTQQYLMVLGGPGVGKSTFLRKMGLEALRHIATKNFLQQAQDTLKTQEYCYKHECIPVMLELRHFSKGQKIEDFIASEFEVCGFPDVKEATELFLSNGKLLVLLDGLDEVSIDTIHYTITEIENLVDRYSENRFIASCRIAAYTFGGFKRFKDVAMATFEDRQIKKFITNWFNKPEDLKAGTAQQCWQLLKSKDYEATKELAQTPLLLTLLCVVYDEYQNFPKKRHTLYSEALDVLIRKWSAEKRVKQTPIYKDFSVDLELELLSEIATLSFRKNQLFFRKKNIINYIKRFFVDNINAPKFLDGESILHAIERDQGILVERAQDTYSFSHLTIQEYLVAKYVTDNNQVDELISRWMTDERWREVFLLVSGLIPGRSGSDTLLLKMERKAHNHLSSEKLQKAVRWAFSQTEESISQITPVAKWSIAIYLIRSLSLALSLTRESDREMALNKIHDLDQKLVRNLDLDALNHKKIDRTRLLKIDPDIALDFMLELNPGEIHKRMTARALCLDFNLALSRALALEGKEYRLLNMEKRSAIEFAKKVVNKYRDLKIFRAIGWSVLLAKLDKISYSIPNWDAAYSIHKKFAEELIYIISQSLKMNLVELRLSNKEIEDLNKYFYANELIIQCKEVAVRVSPKVWNNIKSRILQVDGD